MIKSNLPKLLAERRLSAAKLSKDTGISRTTLSAITTSVAKGIQYETMDTLCKHLGVVPGDLFSYVPFDLSVSYLSINENAVHFKVDDRGRTKECRMRLDVEIHTKSVECGDDDGNVDVLHIPDNVFVDVSPGIQVDNDSTQLDTFTFFRNYIMLLPPGMYNDLERKIEELIVDTITHDCYDAYEQYSGEYLDEQLSSLDVHITLDFGLPSHLKLRE